MPRLSLTDFVDIVSKSGTPKATKVAEVKRRPVYDPAADFYRPLREHLVDLHRNGMPKKAVGRLMTRITDRKKLSNYPGIVAGYTKWWGRKKLEWFEPQGGVFTAHGVEISVNPELGLLVNGKAFLIKLYFKAPGLSKYRVDVATHLMETCLRPMCSQDETMAVLDTRKAKLFSPTVPIPSLSAILDAELAYVGTIWPQL